MGGLFQLGLGGPFRSVHALSLIALVASAASVASPAFGAVPYHPVREGDAMFLENAGVGVTDTAKADERSSSDDAVLLGSPTEAVSGTKAQSAGILRPKMKTRGLWLAALSLALSIGLMFKSPERRVFIVALAVLASAGIAEFVASTIHKRKAEEKFNRAMALLGDVEEGRAKEILRRNLQAPVAPTKPLSARLLYLFLGFLALATAFASVTPKGEVPLWGFILSQVLLGISIGGSAASSFYSISHAAEEAKWMREYKKFIEDYELPESNSEKTDDAAAKPGAASEADVAAGS